MTSIIQGLAITTAALLVYQFAVSNGYGESRTRTMVFTVLLIANIFLTLENRSFYYSILTTMGYRNKLVLYIISITTVITAALIFIPPLAQFFEFEALTGAQLGICSIAGLISVVWYELVKFIKRRKRT
jgi:Ca2+-transporting ATPase